MSIDTNVGDKQIKVNTRGVSRLLLSYPITLRARAARMSRETGISQQEIIRTGIEMYVSQWEAANPEQPAPKPKRTGKAKKAGVK